MRLVLNDLSYKYPGGSLMQLVRGRIVCSQGQGLAIIGDNATGKSTLLKIVAGLLNDHKGSYILPKGSITAFVPTDLSHFLLPWYTVSQNVSFYCSKGRKLSACNLNSLRTELGFILGNFERAEFLERPVYTLSSGQAAAVALICALSINPTILLLDEIFANASKETLDRMVQRLKTYLIGNGILLFSTHRVEPINALSVSTIEIINHA